MNHITKIKHWTSHFAALPSQGYEGVMGPFWTHSGEVRPEEATNHDIFDAVSWSGSAAAAAEVRRRFPSTTEGEAKGNSLAATAWVIAHGTRVLLERNLIRDDVWGMPVGEFNAEPLTEDQVTPWARRLAEFKALCDK